MNKSRLFQVLRFAALFTLAGIELYAQTGDPIGTFIAWVRTAVTSWTFDLSILAMVYGGARMLTGHMNGVVPLVFGCVFMLAADPIITAIKANVHP